jgi:2'-5' RNA ligase
VAREGASRPGAKPSRLFVAVDVPADVREMVEHGVEPIRVRFPAGRWVPLANQHVTMKFLGATRPRLVEGVVASVAEVAARHEAFRTHVARLGAFPSARRARVLWVGLEDPGERFLAIAADLDDALASDFAPETRAFTPHLTVARFEPAVALDEDLTALAVESAPFAVGALTLYRSHLQRPAPRYEAMTTFPLGAPPGGR